MDISVNLKQRKDSGDSLVEERDKTPQNSQSQIQTPSQQQPMEKKMKSPAPLLRPAQIIPPQQQPKNTPSSSH